MDKDMARDDADKLADAYKEGGIAAARKMQNQIKATKQVKN